jgi:hypothetical protein
MFALLMAPDAVHDEMFHATNIWCGQGERKPFCQDIQMDTWSPGAQVNFDQLTCKRAPDTPLICPPSGTGTSFRSVNFGGLYPGGFYFALSWFVVPSFELSMILTRTVSVLLVSILLAFAAALLPRRYQIALIFTLISAMPSTGYLLLSSISPSSWASLGVGIGWLPIHAALLGSSMSPSRRLMLALAGVMMWTMAIVSRWDSVLFIAASAALILAHVIYARKFYQNIPLVILGLVGLVAIFFVINDLVPIHVKPTRFIQLLVSYEPTEPNNLAFFTYQVLQGIPNALNALGTVPTSSGLVIPEVVFVANVSVLAVCILRVWSPENRFQLFGVSMIVLLMTTAIAAQVDLLEARDHGAIEPRYTFPLFLLAVSWWYSSSSTHALDELVSKFRAISRFSLAIFAITTYFVAERFIDRTTYSPRLLPDGLDNWWWSQLPIGPNSILALGIALFGGFLQSAQRLVTASQETLSA